MNEAVEIEGTETAEARPLALDAAHRRAGAVMREEDGRIVPARYTGAKGDAKDAFVAEYEAVRDGGGAGLLDFSARGRIEVGGAEAVQFLNGLVTNDIVKLADGAWMHAAFPNAQGRLLASVRVLRLGERFIFDTEAATHARVLQTLERFTLAGDFRVRDLTQETAMLSVQGARAGDFVRAVSGESAALTERGGVTSAQFQSAGVLHVLRATHTSEDGFDLLVEAANAQSLWESLVEAGARPVGFDVLEVLRVEAGVPRYGVDATDANVVLEVVREEEAVSYTKGCYIGQEIIARIHWRGHVAKQLAGLILGGDAEIPLDARLRNLEGREVGRITSSVYSPRLRSTIALGVLKYDYLEPGTEVKIFDGDRESSTARVAALPLVRGSWFTASETETGAGK